jgi:hypothetical protein
MRDKGGTMRGIQLSIVLLIPDWGTGGVPGLAAVGLHRRDTDGDEISGVWQEKNYYVATYGGVRFHVLLAQKPT